MFKHFYACEKSDELISQSVDEQLQETISADVYSENGYLVVQSFEAADSLRILLQNKSLEEQSFWENQIGLKSAKIFRAEASDKLAKFYDYDKAKAYAEELVEEGYYSMIDSSLCYPFNNYTWDCILNKNGLIKIDDILYCFQKDAQISIIDGKPETLTQFLSNTECIDTALVKVYSYPKLKSTTSTPTSYGSVKSITKKSSGGGVRWTFSLCYGKTRLYIPTPGLQYMQNGVKYYLYFHKEKKATFGWRDSKGTFDYQHITFDFGGNSNTMAPNNYWTRYRNMTPDTDYTQLNESEQSNVYYDLPNWIFVWPIDYNTPFHDGNAPLLRNFYGMGRLQSHNLVISLNINNE